MDRQSRRRRIAGISILSLVGLVGLGIAASLLQAARAPRVLAETGRAAQTTPIQADDPAGSSRDTEVQRIAARADALLAQYLEAENETQSMGDEVVPETSPVDINAGFAPPERLTYRGTVILKRQFGERAWFRIDGARATYDSLYQAQMAVNRQALAGVAMLFDEELLDRFVQADLNRDAKLVWREIRVFQQELYEEFDYKANDVALRPTEFLRSGGGDCEDWALVTSALLRFWGIDSLIAVVKDRAGPDAHAITLMRARTPEVRSQAIYLYERWIRHIPDAEPGLYVPIDYNRVGEVSRAVAPHYWYVQVERPEFVYGLGW